MKKVKLTQNLRPSKKSLTIKFSIILILIIANLIAVIFLLNKPKLSHASENLTIENNLPATESIIGTWYLGDTKYNFNEDNTFSYCSSSSECYLGTYEYVQGEKALEEMSFTTEDLSTEFSTNINIDNLYSIKLYPTNKYVNNDDKSNLIKENTIWWLLFLIKDENNAYAYNKTLNVKYEFQKAS